jgi:ABC-type polysaccharide/polyol phosphate export permease
MRVIDVTEGSEARVGAPASLLREASRQLRSLARFRSLVRYLVSSSLKTQNTGTVFGHVWWVLDPLLLMAVYVLVVDVMLNRGGPDYPVFVFTAVLAWKWFSSSVQQAIAMTVGKESLMRRVAFPRAVLPISSVVAGAIHFVFGLGVLILFAIAFGIYPHPALALLPFIALVQLALILGVALFLSALNIFLRDVGHLTTYFFRLGFYLSPSLYAASQVPEQYRAIYDLNPFATLFPAYRSVIMEHAAPDVAPLAGLAAVSVVVLILGYAFFTRREPLFTKVQ